MLKIGILGGANVVYNRFLPALMQINYCKCSGLATLTPYKAEQFKQAFSIPIFNKYEDLILSPDIDAVYIALPPALHYQWAKETLMRGKHVLLEKPATTNLNDAISLVNLAKKSNLVVYENYMFLCHSQIKKIMELISNDLIGEVYQYNAAFGFPMRENDDYRYKKELGGGALLDVGGYIIKLASFLLGVNNMRFQNALLKKKNGYDVDMFGNVVLDNNDGVIFNGSFGMDCFYQCSIEAWGNKGRLSTNRIFTAPPDYVPIVELQTKYGKETILLQKDNQFINSINLFYYYINDIQSRNECYNNVIYQSEWIEKIFMNAKEDYCK